MPEIAIVGIGTAVPDHIVSQAESLAFAREFSCANEKQRRIVGGLYKRSGVDTRFSVIEQPVNVDVDERFFPPRLNDDEMGPSTATRMQRYKTEAVPLALEASSSALRSSGIDPSRVTHLITVTCTGFFAPGVDIELIRYLPLSNSVKRTQIGFMGCHGGIIGLRTAADIVAGQPDAVVLVSCVELCSLHYQYEWKSDTLVANSLFADGAASFVVQAGADNRGVTYLGHASLVVPDSLDLMTWDIGNHGFAIGLSPEVPNVIEKHLKTWLSSELTSRFGMSIDDIKRWAVHPGGPKILDAVQASVDLAPSAMEPSRSVLSRYGNMSSPTVLFILNELVSQHAEGPCLILGFGPGLTIEAALLKL